MSFGLGLITGIAESVDRELQLDMKRNLDRIDTLSTLRTNTLTKNREDYESRMSATRSDLKEIQRNVGGDVEVTQYLIDTYGDLETAKEKAKQIDQVFKNTGGVKSHAQIVNLISDPEKNITLDQLAKSLTAPPPKQFAMATTQPVGLMKLFDDDISDDVMRQSDELLAASGISTTSYDFPYDVAQSYVSGNLREWELNMPDDFAKREAYLARVETGIRTNGLFTNDKKLIIEADAIRTERNFADIMRQIETGGREEMSTTLLEKTKKSVMAKLAMNWVGSEEIGNLFQNGIFTPELMKQYQDTILSDEANRILLEINKAKKAGVGATEINFMVDMAINMNRSIEFVDTDDADAMAMGLPDGQLQFKKNEDGEFIAAIPPDILRGRQDPPNFFEPIFPNNKFITPQIEQGVLSMIDDMDVVALFRKYKVEGKLNTPSEVQKLKDDIMELGYKAAQVDNLFESSNITQ